MREGPPGTSPSAKVTLGVFGGDNARGGGIGESDRPGLAGEEIEVETGGGLIARVGLLPAVLDLLANRYGVEFGVGDSVGLRNVLSVVCVVLSAGTARISCWRCGGIAVA